MYISTTDSKERLAGKLLVHNHQGAEQSRAPGRVASESVDYSNHPPLSNIIRHITETPDPASLHMYCRGLLSAFNIEHYEIFASIRQPLTDARLMHVVNGVEIDASSVETSVSCAAFQEYCFAASLPKLWTSQSCSETEFVTGLLRESAPKNMGAADYLYACIPWHGASGSAGGLKLQCQPRDNLQCREMESTILKLAFLTPYILETMAKFVGTTSKKVKKGVLTDREKDVLHQLALGHSTADVAKILGISINTVTTHTRKIHEKLQVNNRQQAVIRAINMNLISLA